MMMLCINTLLTKFATARESPVTRLIIEPVPLAASQPIAPTQHEEAADDRPVGLDVGFYGCGCGRHPEKQTTLCQRSQERIRVRQQAWFETESRYNCRTMAAKNPLFSSPKPVIAMI